jgi:uncharacterized protein (TIGR04255 family)
VICQLRFPTILKIETEIPSKFQDAIRKEFPLYNKKIEYNLSSPLNFNNQGPFDIINKISRTSTTVNHEFSSIDNKWQINLGKTFISITSNEYHNWKEFMDFFNGPLEVLIKEYEPSIFTRIGLRYVDIIDKKKFGIDQHIWADLINPELLGLLSSDFHDRINNVQTTHEMNLEEDNFLRIITSIVRRTDNPDQCYLIDSDFFNNTKNEFDKIHPILEYLHTEADNFIQWAVSKLLHDSMEPEEHEGL